MVAQKVLSVLINSVTEPMNRLLLEEVSEREVRDAVFNMGSLKALGPDGFPSLFFQPHWEVIKIEIAIVKNFVEIGILNPMLNKTLIALVPKV